MKKFGYVLTTSNTNLGRKLGKMSGVASGFRSKVSLSDEHNTVPLSDVRSRQALNLSCGGKMTVMVEGLDEEAAVAALQNYVVSSM